MNKKEFERLKNLPDHDLIFHATYGGRPDQNQAALHLLETRRNERMTKAAETSASSSEESAKAAQRSNVFAVVSLIISIVALAVAASK